jgi:hypothetical protein
VILAALNEAQAMGARLHAACGVIVITGRKIERWRSRPGGNDRRCEPRCRPRNAEGFRNSISVRAIVHPTGAAESKTDA